MKQEYNPRFKLRTCLIDGSQETCYFHQFCIDEKSINGGKSISVTRAIVETNNGQIIKVEPEVIRFTDITK